LNFATTAELGAALKARKISALELTDHVIARIEALDPKLNAVVVRDFDRGRDAAKSADAALARGEARELTGIPMVIKESFDIAGLPTTWGVPAFKDHKPQQDALSVSRLKAAGVVMLGKTNVPLVLGDFQSYNDIYGTTNNPWDLGRTPGGSSGGSSAALSAGFGPLSFGSDIGGSLRAPAHYCGVYAHKPTLGLVPPRGHGFPGLTPREADLAVVGPMARSAADLDLALSISMGPDELRDGVGYRAALPAPRHQALNAFRVLVIDDHPSVPANAATRAALARLAQQLGQAGVKVSHHSPLLPDSADAAAVYMRLLMAAFSERWIESQYRDAEAAAAALKPEDKTLTAERMRGAVMSHRQWAADAGARIKLQQQWRALFCEFDVVIMATMPTPAFPHDHSPMPARVIDIDGKPYPYFDQIAWAGVATLPGLPATGAPIGLSDTGLPIGVQIIGPYLEDRTPITFAALMEREFGGFVPPPAHRD
jgi:amidase